MKMTIQELIDEFSNEQGFQFGIDIVMKSLRPNALYGLSASGGTFEIVSWDESNELPPPTSQEIRDEYIRHQTIKEFLDYMDSQKKKKKVTDITSLDSLDEKKSEEQTPKKEKVQKMIENFWEVYKND